MLYIVTTSYEEALPFISECSLKKSASFSRFELFLNDSIRLLISKTGAVRAAIAVSSLLTAYPPMPEDFFLSVGTAGWQNLDSQESNYQNFNRQKSGYQNFNDQESACQHFGKQESGYQNTRNIFLIREIRDRAAGRAFFPELLYCSPFPEAILETVPMLEKNPISEEASISGKTSISEAVSFIQNHAVTIAKQAVPLLYDTQGSGIYEAAAMFFPIHRIALLRVVSDYSSCIKEELANILQWICKLPDTSLSSPPLLQESDRFFNDCCAALRLSSSGRQQLLQLMRYLQLSGCPYLDIMKNILAKPLCEPCKNKKEGKYYLELLHSRFL